MSDLAPEAAQADPLTREFARLLKLAQSLNQDVDEEVLEILHAAASEPLGAKAAHGVLTRVLTRLAELAAQRGDEVAAKAIGDRTESLVAEVAAARARLAAPLGSPGGQDTPPAAPHQSGHRIELQGYNGIQPGPVSPRPTYAGRQVPMHAGFMPLRALDLRETNERLEIHVDQLYRDRGRGPTPDELVDIMLGRLPLPGLEREDDQFKIVALARSIANNGIRVPPVIDLDGTVLDGNRRLAACRYILESDEFDLYQRARADWVYVWQLTEHADDEDRRLVVTGLNFEEDLKEQWPTYIKARKVHEHWGYMLDLEPRPTQARLREMKKELSRHFALGPDPATVNRYLKMVDVAEEFEDHHTEERGRDMHEVKHASSRHFEYFDELSKGAKPGGVRYILEQDDSLRRLVFDLLFEGKFKRFSQIRDLRYVPENSDILPKLREAAHNPDPGEARDTVDTALAWGRAQAKENREFGANVRIKAFVDWLLALPVSAFSERIDHANLVRLQQALRLVDAQVAKALDEEDTH